MAMAVEFLGTAGAMPTPRPLCRCEVCREARHRGVPFARSGPSVFVHGPDVLIDTPAEIVDQLNRSSVDHIAACFYSHWHPDHTMGRHVFATLNADYRNWPARPRGVTDVYLPEQVAADSRRFLALRDHLAFLEDRERVVHVHELRDGDSIGLGATTVRPLRLAQDFVYAFLFEQPDRRLLVVPDEMDGWVSPAEARGVDLAVVPMGIAERHPLTGERLIAEEHPVLQVEATFDETLAIVAQIAPERVLFTHIEESDGLSHGVLEQVAATIRDGGLNAAFAYDTMVVEVEPPRHEHS